MPKSTSKRLRLLAYLLSLPVVTLFGLPCAAQVLARPGWAGSGVAPEVWWNRAVLYRLDPLRFQDSDGDGKGDLPGIVQRLDYLQSLGVDAVVLDAPLGSGDTESLEDLVREASRRQLRVLVTAAPPAPQTPQSEWIRTVRGWLSAGAAGLWCPRDHQAESDAAFTARTGALRSLLQSFPGERILITDPGSIALDLAPRSGRSVRRIRPESFHAAKGAVLLTKNLPMAAQDRLAATRTAMAEGEDAVVGSGVVLRLASSPPTASPDASAEATLLLGARGAVLLNFGQELGLDLYPAANSQVADPPPVMQWTSSNHTPPAATAQDGTQPAAEPVFGTYHPYVPPPRGLAPSSGSPVHVTPDLNIPEALPAPDTLPGFTAGSLPASPEDGARRNVVTEDRDPKSLLNVYRQLIAIHHGNATVRNGSQTVLNQDAEQALVWIRRAPAGSRTVANVVGAINVSDHQVGLNLDADLEAQGMRPGALHPLFSSAAEMATGETTGHLVLPPHGAFLGEIYHAGSLPEVSEHAARGRRRSGHRVRR